MREVFHDHPASHPKVSSTENNPPFSNTSPIEEREQESDGEFLERSRLIGDYYTSLINSFVGRDETKKVSLEGIDDPAIQTLRAIEEKMRTFFECLHLKIASERIDGKKLLEQVPSFRTSENKVVFSDTSKVRVEELSPGHFVVFVESELLSQITNSTGMGSCRALAIRPSTQGIPFILLRDYKNPEENKQSFQENIPHETHHLAWWHSAQDGIIISTEEDPDIAESFYMFQDELMAKLCSNGYINAYSHLKLLDRAQLNEFTRTKPKVAEDIFQNVGDLNELLEEISSALQKTGLKKSDLIKSVIAARNFTEMRDNLLRAKTIIERQPITYTESIVKRDKWGDVIT